MCSSTSSKVSWDWLYKAMQEVLPRNQHKHWKCSETVELQVSLKNYDPIIRLRSTPCPTFSRCDLGWWGQSCGYSPHGRWGPEASIRLKKSVKKLAKKYDTFWAPESLIKHPRILGPGLNKLATSLPCWLAWEPGGQSGWSEVRNQSPDEESIVSGKAVGHVKMAT